MKSIQITNKKIAVLGYGTEGLATTKYLLKHGVKPVLFDQKPFKDWPKDILKMISNQKLQAIFDPNCFDKLINFDIAFRSPGIKLTPEISKKAPQTVFTSQTNYFFSHCPAKIIGITGTKGKGTTATLISKIVQNQFNNTNFHSQPKVYLTGNIGGVQPLDFLDNLTRSDCVIYELSSFQLQDLKISPHISVILMITPEHLDYHKNFNEYLKAKMPICQYQNQNDFCIINSDYKTSIQIGKHSNGKKIYFSTQNVLKNGCYVKNKKIFIKNVQGNNFSFFANKVKLFGRFNLQNVCAAATASICANITKNSIINTVSKFHGLEHRLEFVCKRKKISFYNDSFSTTPETAIAAIKSFSQNLIVILGGSTKKSNFSSLIKTIKTSKNIKSLILIGPEGRRLYTKLKKMKINIYNDAKNMKEIFQFIKIAAKPNYTVLLSPGCASFGIFKNYKDRGAQFKKYASKF